MKPFTLSVEGLHCGEVRDDICLFVLVIFSENFFACIAAENCCIISVQYRTSRHQRTKADLWIHKSRAKAISVTLVVGLERIFSKPAMVIKLTPLEPVCDC